MVVVALACVFAGFVTAEAGLIAWCSEFLTVGFMTVGACHAVVKHFTLKKGGVLKVFFFDLTVRIEMR